MQFFSKTFICIQHAFFRPCDSSNLNLSPLCQLKENSSPNLWADSVRDSYLMNNGKIENYIEELSRSTRPFYKDRKALENELLPGIVEVFSFSGVTRIFFWGVIGWTFPKVIYVDIKTTLPFEILPIYSFQPWNSSLRVRILDGVGSK